MNPNTKICRFFSAAHKIWNFHVFVPPNKMPFRQPLTPFLNYSSQLTSSILVSVEQNARKKKRQIPPVFFFSRNATKAMVLVAFYESPFSLNLDENFNNYAMDLFWWSPETGIKAQDDLLSFHSLCDSFFSRCFGSLALFCPFARPLARIHLHSISPVAF